MILVLPFRHKPDFTLLWQTAQELKWSCVRWPLRAPFPELGNDKIVVYVDPVTAQVFCDSTGRKLTRVPLDWLPLLPIEFTKRKIRFGLLSQLK